MKKSLILLVLIIASRQMISAQADDKSVVQLAVMSYNIRYDNPADGISSWDNRKSKVSSLLEFYHPQVFGLQEALLSQIQYLDESLADYDWIGVGRDDGLAKGEYSPVFYDKNILELKEWGTFWLSETPEKPSTGWDAALPRVCTWTRFILKSDNRELYFFNTHFDHKGENARFESSKLIVDKIKDLKSGSKVILVGDFNQKPESQGYSAITGQLVDSYTISKSSAYGPKGTFSGFESGKELGDRIDYIFVNQGLACDKFRTITDQDGKYYPSDHLPVIAIISW